MSLILCIETSADPSIAGMVKGGEVIARREIAVRDRFAGTVQEMLASASLTAQDFSAIAIGEGPGSFTGLRVGFAFAQGFALVTGLPIWPVASLLVFAANARGTANSIAAISPAKKGKQHFTEFDGQSLAVTQPHRVVADEELANLLHPGALLVGPGVAKLSADLKARLGARIPPEPSFHRAHVGQIATLAAERWQGKPVNNENAKPFYGLDFGM